jgi:hypothetical protein
VQYIDTRISTRAGGQKGRVSNQYLDNTEFESIIERYQRSQREKLRYELMVDDLKGAAERVKRKAAEKAEAVKKAKVHLDKAVFEYKDCQQQLAFQFYTLAESIVRWRNFSLIDDEDAVQEGVLICFEKIDRFDSSKGSAFNYLTTCVLNHFRQLWRSARNYNELKIKYQDFLCSSFEEFVARNLRERLKAYRSNSESKA